MEKSKNTTKIEWTDDELHTMVKAMIISSRQNDSLDEAISAMIALVQQNEGVKRGETQS